MASLRCPPCGGRVFYDEDDDELYCIRCARRWFLEDGKWVDTKPAPQEEVEEMQESPEGQP